MHRIWGKCWCLRNIKNLLVYFRIWWPPEKHSGVNSLLCELIYTASVTEQQLGGLGRVGVVLTNGQQRQLGRDLSRGGESRPRGLPLTPVLFEFGPPAHNCPFQGLVMQLNNSLVPAPSKTWAASFQQQLLPAYHKKSSLP